MKIAEKIIFLRVAWMQYYQGVQPDDVPNGAGWYVSQNKDGGEVLNFKPINGKYYGYARIRKGDSLNISRLGAAKQDAYIDDVTVVLFAKDPSLGGQFVVGWYRHARLYRKVQEGFSKRAPQPVFMSEAKVSDSVLLPIPLRKFETPSDGPGQTNAWYAQEYSGRTTYLKELDRFMKDPAGYGKPTGKGGGGWMKDVEKRKKIEVAAMTATESFLATRALRSNMSTMTRWDGTWRPLRANRFSDWK